MSKIEIPKSCEIECMFIGGKFLICVRSARIKLKIFTDLQITERNSGCVMNLHCYFFLSILQIRSTLFVVFLN